MERLPGTGAVPDGSAAGLPPRPYPGLRPFETDEWPVFFGRERMADEVVARLVRQRIVFVHGDSGCGKSSLVRAGVFAQLLSGSAGGPWRTATALPRRTPLWNVAAALARFDDVADDDANVFEWRRALNFGRHAPDALTELRRGRGAPQPACLLIDQFEELFQHAQREGPDEAQRLIETLIAWHERPPEGLYAILTMRSEYLGACGRFPGFAEMVNATQYLLPRMDHEDMLRAIREPARLYDGEVTRELAERLIADAGGGQDQLPLIQHGLMRLHRRHAADTAGPWELGLAAFPGSGGLAGLLSEHADEVAAQCRPALAAVGAERAVEDLFRALTDCNPDGQPIRRPQTLKQLAETTGTSEAVLRPVIDAFRADGVSFLTTASGAALAPGDLIDIGHEALIRCWRALAEPSDGWLVRELRTGLVWRSLLVQAESFEQDPRNVLSAATTDERESWLKRRNSRWAERYGGGWDRVQRLIDASCAARDRERAEAAAALRKAGRERALRWGLAVAVVFVLGLALALWTAMRQYRESRIQFQRAAEASSSRDELKRETDALEARRRELNQQLAQSAEALGRVQRELTLAVNETAAPSGLRTRILDATKELDQQAESLTTAAKEPRPLPISSGPQAGIQATLYIHIAEESQRRSAMALERALEALAGKEIVLPGIDLVKDYPSRAELRCFQPEECRGEARKILAMVQRSIAAPEVQLRDLSARYGKVAGVRPRQYELWFPPGEIVPRAGRGGTP